MPFFPDNHIALHHFVAWFAWQVVNMVINIGIQGTALVRSDNMYYVNFQTKKQESSGTFRVETGVPIVSYRW